MASERARITRGVSRRTIVVGLIVLIIVGVVVAFTLLPYGDSSNIVQHWQLRIHFYDANTGMNSTPPAFIGIAPQFWVNHTLDRFGPGHSPISTRDDSGTIYIDSNYPAVFTFGDLFNVWGQPFSATCVRNYCAVPAELVIKDVDGSNSYSTGDIVLNGISGAKPTTGAILSSDPRIKFMDTNNNGVWDSGEPVVYDTNNNAIYATGDPVIYSGQATLNPGQKLTSDPSLKFVDTNNDKVWNDTIPAPVMSDSGSNEGCVRNYALSNGKDWIIVTGSASLAGHFGCQP